MISSTASSSAPSLLNTILREFSRLVADPPAADRTSDKSLTAPQTKSPESRAFTPLASSQPDHIIMPVNQPKMP